MYEKQCHAYKYGTGDRQKVCVAEPSQFWSAPRKIPKPNSAPASGPSLNSKQAASGAAYVF